VNDVQQDPFKLIQNLRDRHLPARSRAASDDPIVLEDFPDHRLRAGYVRLPVGLAIHELQKRPLRTVQVIDYCG